MSYDINIQKDKEYSEHTDVEALKVFIASFPGITANGEAFALPVAGDLVVLLLARGLVACRANEMACKLRGK